jgi:hypothetical protein
MPLAAATEKAQYGMVEKVVKRVDDGTVSSCYEDLQE